MCACGISYQYSMICSISKIDEIMSQVGMQKLGVPVFFTAAAVHGLLK